MRVAEIQRFCMHDGPGVRTTVFLKGCPLGCVWCHNPETQNQAPELLYYANKCIGCGACTVCVHGAHTFTESHTVDRARCVGCGNCVPSCPSGALERIGDEMTVEEVLVRVQRDRAFYGEHGGITVSGGEPFLQAGELKRLLRLCKENGIHTAIETCGFFPSTHLSEIAPLCDLFLWDIKDTCDERHRQNTGVSNQRIIDNLRLADSLGAGTRIRCILLNGVNTNEQHYTAIAELYHHLHHCEGVQLLPYHTYGGAKAMALGLPNTSNDEWIPTAAQLREANIFFTNHRVTVYQ